MKHLASGKSNLQPGNFNNPAEFYRMVETNVAGAVTRTPALAFRAKVNHAPFQAFENREVERELGQIWSIITMRYAPSRLPLEGWQIVLTRLGETYEIKGVRHIDGGFRKIEIDGQLVR